MQVKLDKGEKVKLLGEEKEGYCKISPPDGAYLWVSNQYIKPLGSLMPPPQPMPMLPATSTPAAPPGPAAPFPTATEASAAKSQPKASSPNEPTIPPPAPLSADAQKVKELDALKAKVDAEKAKPIEQQNFSELKKQVSVLANDKQSVRLARLAQNLLKNIERFELAQEVAKAAKIQEEQFGQIQQRIENAKNEKLSQLEDLSIFAVIGQLKETTLFSATPGAKYFRVFDSEGKTMCYAYPAGAAVSMDLSKFIDKKVGLVGTVEAQPELGAVVQFTNIVELP
jgi:hypothetical protein